MKVQLLWFPGCPNVDAARAALRDAMARVGSAEPIDEIDVSAPSAPPELRNWGSPTILIDGADVGGQPAAAGASCRLYDGARVPSIDAIERALRAARAVGVATFEPAVADRRATRTDRLAGAGAIFAALVASACCIGPAILALLGLGDPARDSRRHSHRGDRCSSASRACSSCWVFLSRSAVARPTTVAARHRGRGARSDGDG